MLRRVLGETVVLDIKGVPGSMVRADQGMMEQVLTDEVMQEVVRLMAQALLAVLGSDAEASDER